MDDIDYYLGLLFECPAGARLDTCPLKTVENLSNKEKIDWYESLSYEDKNEIIYYHKFCSSRR